MTKYVGHVYVGIGVIPTITAALMNSTDVTGNILSFVKHGTSATQDIWRYAVDSATETADDVTGTITVTTSDGSGWNAGGTISYTSGLVRGTGTPYTGLNFAREAAYPIADKWVYDIPVAAGFTGTVNIGALFPSMGAAYLPIAFQHAGTAVSGMSVNATTGAVTFATSKNLATPLYYNMQATAANGKTAYYIVKFTKAVVSADYAFYVHVPAGQSRPTVTSVTDLSNTPLSLANIRLLGNKGDVNGNSVYGFVITAPVDTAQFTGNFTVTTAGGSAYSITRDAVTSATLTTASGAAVAFNINKFTGVLNMASPIFVSVSALNVAENTNSLAVYTAVATDGDGDTLAYTLSGTDSALFSINASTGVVSFLAQPDYETPADANADNVYEITVSANDGVTTVDQAVSITITDASEADTTHAVDSAAVANMLAGEMTIDSVAAVISGLAVAADAADTANKQELQNAIDAVEESVAVAQAAADRLESYEMGQIEDLLNQLVETEGFQALLETATVTVNGNVRTVASILQAMAEAPQVANWKRTSDTDGKMNGVIVTLTSGDAVTFGMTTEVVDATTNKHIFSVEDFAGSGIPKSFYFIMKEKTMDFGASFGGRLVATTLGWFVTEQSNILFDLTGTEAGAGSTVTVPDYNGDTVTGNA